MDGFVLSRAEELGIKIETFGLPSDLKAFTRETKTVTTQDDKRFKTLFLHLRNAGEIKILGNVLNYLKDKKYAAAIDDLKQLMSNSEMLLK